MMDSTSKYTRIILRIFIVSNPQGTGIGICIGFVLDLLMGLFSPVLKAVELINIAAVKIYHLMALGVLGVNLPHYLLRKEVDPEITKAIDYIEAQHKAGRISIFQKKQMFDELFSKLIKDATLNLDKEENMADKILDELKPERKDPD